MKLIPVKYHNKEYPKGMVEQLVEVAGNFDSKELEIVSPYSLHTEYSYMKRSFASNLLDGLDEIKNSQKDGIPQLWKSAKWSEEFATFIKRLIGTSIAPEVIEIHPPFKDYCKDVKTFWERYLIFYRSIMEYNPSVKILIENRCGTFYSSSQFLFSTCKDMLELGAFLSEKNGELGMIVDYPQLFSAEKIKMDNVNLSKILDFNNKLKDYTQTVGAIHLWGKMKSSKGRWTPHSGDLDTFFSYDKNKKATFLNSMKVTFNDDKARYFVPEVNTTESDLQSIVRDLIDFGFEFVQKDFKEHLLAIDWEYGKPQFVLNSNLKEVRRIDAVGNYSINIGPRKYCIGNKDILTHEYLGCPDLEIQEDSKKCEKCNRKDILKYCRRCTGNECFSKRDDVLNRCNQEHFVYLTFFPDDIVKVGVAHNRRKYIRLLEQGALYSLIIASCSTGRNARVLEDFIKKLGVSDKVLSKVKISNLLNYDLDKAIEELNKTYHSVKDALLLKNVKFEGVIFFDKPEIFNQQETISCIKKLSSNKYVQLSIWDYMEESDNIVAEIIEDIDGFNGSIEAFVGDIAILSQDNQYYLFDFKSIIGREINIINK